MSATAIRLEQTKEARIFNDETVGTPIILVLEQNYKSFFAFERPARDMMFALQNTLLISKQIIYNPAGKPLNESGKELRKINACQKFWHSWQTFHPNID